MHFILRKKLFLSNIELLNLNSSSPYTGEVLVEFSSSFHGKNKVLDELMWLRSYENDPIHNENWNRELDIEAWYNNNEHQNEVTKCINRFSKIVSKSAGISERMVKRYAISGLNTMCGINYKLSEPRSLIVSFQAMVKAKFTKLIKYHLYSNYKNRFGWIDFGTYKDKILDPEKIIYNIDELSNIFNLIKDTDSNS